MTAPESWSFTTQSCPCTIWSDTTTPSVPSVGPGGPLELGVKFRSDVGGYVRGVRFYKGAGNGGTHVGHLWSSGGVLLGSATFESETAEGWQQVSFASPVVISANTTYVASYHAPNGGYAYDGAYFATATTRGSLQALASGDAGGNGVFRSGGGFPTDSYNSTNYWVDVVFSTTPPPDTRPPTVIDRQPAPNAANASPRPAVRATFDEPIDPTSLLFELRDLGGAVVPSSVVYDDATRTATLTPNGNIASGATFRTTVSARDPAGNQMAPESWSFSTPNCPCSLWSDAVAPQYAATNPTPIELGVRVQGDMDGYVTALRFYKDAANTGTHVAHLWSGTGALLASATFKDETAEGWQQVTISPAVPLTAGQTYVVSYSSPTGRYSYEPAYFAAGYQSGPLRAPASGGNNGVYGAVGALPTNSYNATNYWVDLVFSTTPPADTTPPTTVARAPSPGSTDASVAPAVRATFSEPIVGGSVSFVLRDAAGGTVPASLSYDDASRTATLAPSVELASGASYTATVSGATDLAGNAMTAPESWSFTTAVCPCSIWGAAATPTIGSVGPGAPLELGVKFRSDAAGRVTGISFYKGAGNTGTHVAHLWSGTGALLATAAFESETAEGWQQVTFAAPVAITANTTYVASYFAPNGGYAYDGGYFASGVSRGPLHALASGADGGNGVFRDGVSGFPTDSYNAANYWVDVSFTTGP
jgi:hypothetical protein